MEHKLVPCLVRRAAWLVAHDHVNAGGQTSREQLLNIAHDGEVVDFVETVNWKGWSVACRSFTRQEHGVIRTLHRYQSRCQTLSFSLETAKEKSDGR